MARTIQKIKEEMTRQWMGDARVARAYGFEAGAEDFDSRFGAASIENLLFYVWAACAWAVEKLMDELREETRATVEAEMPHRARWYKERAMEFRDGEALDGDTCRYKGDVKDKGVLVVAQAAATEDRATGRLLVKVAGEDKPGEYKALDGGCLERLREYMAEIKDAGVRLAIVSKDGDPITVKASVEYNPLLKPKEVEAGCKAAVESYVKNLPFNGEYTRMGLMKALEAVEGVEIVGNVEARSGGSMLGSRKQPSAGYFKIDGITISMLPYDTEV